VFEQVVLGVDPGTAAVGVAAVRGSAWRASVEWAGTLRTPPGAPGPERLRAIYRGVRRAIARHRPEVLAVERLLFGRNAESGIEVARATGAVLVAAAEAGIRVEEYAPAQVKVAVTGVGNASKEAVRRGLVRLLGPGAVPSDPDAADAVAVALCHLQLAGLRRAARGDR
jgi:crossover junction endodeoxyribonuclease RuvC